jgi:hypothetical protein
MSNRNGFAFVSACSGTTRGGYWTHDSNQHLRRSDDAPARRPRLLAPERECQAGNDEGQEEDRQDPLSPASEGDGFALARVERSRFGWSFVRCGLVGCDVRVRLVSRSGRSVRVIRQAFRPARRRTCRDGPPLRSFCASASMLPSSLISSCSAVASSCLCRSPPAVHFADATAGQLPIRASSMEMTKNHAIDDA